jgi:hypothetical protein
MWRHAGSPIPGGPSLATHVTVCIEPILRVDTGQIDTVKDATTRLLLLKVNFFRDLRSIIEKDLHLSPIPICKFLKQSFTLHRLLEVKITNKIAEVISWAIAEHTVKYVRMLDSKFCLVQLCVEHTGDRWDVNWIIYVRALRSY